MTDDRLRRTLQIVDGPVRPSGQFVEDLHARLAAELGFGEQTIAVDRVRPHARPNIRRRGRAGWLAVAALPVLALVALLLAQQGRAPEESPTPPSGSPSIPPTGAPSQIASAEPAAPPSPIPSLDALRGNGLVVFELASLTDLPRLRVLRQDLSSAELLPDVPGVQGRPAWRPDGERLAFVGYDPAHIDARPMIWETDGAGASPTLVSVECDPPDCAAESEPAYSPDGNQLVLVRTRLDAAGSEVFVVAVRDLTTGDAMELEATSVARAEAAVLHPRWSPDGRTIAYGVATYDESGFADGSVIHLIEVDGTNDRILTQPELEAGDPEWSPDGGSIIFSSQPIRAYAAEGNRDATAMHLYQIGIDGSDPRAFELVGAVGAPTWTPTGDQILFTYLEGAGDLDPGHGRLFVMDPDGSNVLPVTSTLRTPAWYGVQQPAP